MGFFGGSLNFWIRCRVSQFIFGFIFHLFSSFVAFSFMCDLSFCFCTPGRPEFNRETDLIRLLSNFGTITWHFFPNIYWQLKTKKCLYLFKHHLERPWEIYFQLMLFNQILLNTKYSFLCIMKIKLFFSSQKNILQQNWDWKLGFGDLFVWKPQMSQWALRNSKRQFSVFSTISNKTWGLERKKKSLANRKMTKFHHSSSWTYWQISWQETGF